MMIAIDPMSRKPIYDQLMDQISRLIVLGVYAPGDQLPSVRSLSCQLSVNPNTIQKAYTQLCNAGVTLSAPGKGCFVAPNALQVLQGDARGRLPALGAFVEELADSGLSSQEILEFVEKTLQERSRK